MTRLFALLFLLTSPLTAQAASEKVEFSGYKPGTIVVKTGDRQLYYVLSGSEALRYRVAVGRDHMQWIGRHIIDAKYMKPAWSAPPSIQADYRKLPRVIPGGDKRNPMGAAALMLRDTNYAIHGTNEPQLIGQFVSHGCIRMLNEDVLEVFEKVVVDKTEVIVQP